MKKFKIEYDPFWNMNPYRVFIREGFFKWKEKGGFATYAEAYDVITKFLGYPAFFNHRGVPL